jgi:endonuclease III
MPAQVHKKPFDFDRAMTAIRHAVEPFPKAAMFALAEAGFSTPFQQLVACIISIRTRDEVSLPAALRLLGTAGSASAMLALSVAEIDALIQDVTFHDRKAGQIRKIAHQVAEEHDEEALCRSEVLVSFAGVGPKCANLTLGIACDVRRISVDIHVHRVTNRWGIVATRYPEETESALAQVLPDRYWVEINALLVPFGKHICTGVAPRCSNCPVLQMCDQVGVTTHR